MEYGIFNDKEMLEGGFCRKEEAEDALVRYQHNYLECYALMLCEHHYGQPMDGCEDCQEEKLNMMQERIQ